MTALNPPIRLVIAPDSCIGCGECIHGCPRQALRFSRRILVRDRSRCNFCLNCLEICPSQGHRLGASSAPPHKRQRGQPPGKA